MENKTNEKKRSMTKLQKLSLNLKIILLIVILILLGFFAAYMFATSLDDVLNSAPDGEVTTTVVTKVYEIGGEDTSLTSVEE